MEDNYFGVLLEDVQSQIMSLAEAMSDVPSTVRRLDHNMQALQADMKLMKSLWQDHEIRSMALEEVE